MSSHTTHAMVDTKSLMLYSLWVSHIVQNYPTAVKIYQMVNPAMQNILRAKSELPMIESIQISTEIESVISES
jgi:hypothetical protein